MYPVSARQLVKDAKIALTYVSDRVGTMMDDPMSDGAPVNDFIEVWERRARVAQANVLRLMQRQRISRRWRDRLIEALTAHI